jgi:hypothetical protein
MAELEKNIEELSQENQKLKLALKSNKTSSSSNLPGSPSSNTNINDLTTEQQQQQQQQRVIFFFLAK